MRPWPTPLPKASIDGIYEKVNKSLYNLNLPGWFANR
jgi:hypothetical protein